VGLGPQRHWAWPGKVAWPIWLFWLLTENRGALLPIDTDGLWSTVEWPRSKPAGWRRRGGWGSLDGSSIAEGISGRGRTSASRSRGHLWGPSGWRGSTRRHDAWCGVEAVGQGLKRAVYGAQWWCARRCNGGEAGGGERKRKGAPRWGSPFIGARGGAVAKPWVAKRRRQPQSGCHRYSLGADVQTVRLTSGSTRFQVFLNLSKTGPTYKIEKDAFLTWSSQKCQKFSIFVWG
jgi:hypothetical protein